MVGVADGTIVLRFETEGLQQALGRLQWLAAQGRNLRVPLARAGAVILKAVDENFEAEGRPRRWKPRSPLTMAALRGEAVLRTMATKRYRRAVKASTRGKYLRQAVAKADSRKILQVTGGLRNSMVMRVEGGRVIVGSAHPAARIHQLGGTIKPRKATRLSIPVGNRLVQVRSVTIPARPFLVVTETDEEKILRVFVEWLSEKGLN